MIKLKKGLVISDKDSRRERKAKIVTNPKDSDYCLVRNVDTGRESFASKEYLSTRFKIV